MVTLKEIEEYCREVEARFGHDRGALMRIAFELEETWSKGWRSKGYKEKEETNMINPEELDKFLEDNMGEAKKRNCELVVPKPKSGPARRYGALEIQDEGRREAVVDALGKLWYAIGLHYGGRRDGVIGYDEVELVRVNFHRQIHRAIGETLLGDEYEGGEEMC